MEPKLKRTKKPAQATQEEKSPKAQVRALGRIKVRMCCVEEKNEWNFKAQSPPDAVNEGKRICQENGFRWSDIVVWEFS